MSEENTPDLENKLKPEEKTSDPGKTLKTVKTEKKTSDLKDNFRTGIFLIAMILLLVATFQLYFSIGNVIQVWFEYRYIPIFRAIYNFFVLAISLYIIRLYILR